MAVGPSRRSGAAVELATAEHQFEELANAGVLLERVTEWYGAVDAVVIASSDPFPVQSPLFDQVAHDAVRRTLGDANLLGDLAQGQVRIVREADQNVRVIREEVAADCICLFGLLC